MYFTEYFHSFLLSQVFGLYMVVIAVIMLSRVKFYREVVERVHPHSGGLLLVSSLGLFFGLFLITIHNIWVLEPRLLVTILAWFITIKSILWLSFPECMLKCAKRLYEGPWYYVIMAIILAIGIVFLTKGFYLFV